MYNMFETILRQQRIPYTVERNGITVNEFDGLINREDATKRRYIGFMPNADVVIEDWLINEVGDRFYVEEIKTSFIQKKPFQKQAFILSETEYSSTKKPTTEQTINIGAAYGSVIGNQSYFTLNYSSQISEIRKTIEDSNSSDKEELNKITDLLEMILDNQIPVSKGLFSKFREVMERNSWITGSIASAILSWLMSQTQ